jgi:hypothetical protein
LEKPKLGSTPTTLQWGDDLGVDDYRNKQKRQSLDDPASVGLPDALMPMPDSHPLLL